MTEPKDLSGIYSVNIVGQRTDKTGGGDKGQDAALNKEDLSYVEYGILMHYLIDAANKAFLEMAKVNPDPVSQMVNQVVKDIQSND